MDENDNGTALDVSNLVRRTTLDEFLGQFDRRAKKHPDRAPAYMADKAQWRSEIETMLTAGDELWHWRRPPDDPVCAFGIAAVRDGRIVKWWVRGHGM